MTLRDEVETLWDRIHVGFDYEGMEVEMLPAGDVAFAKVHRPGWTTPPRLAPRVLIREYRGLWLSPRTHPGYEYQLSIVPTSTLARTGRRWHPVRDDIEDVLTLANEIGYVVTFSSYKSGASAPDQVHYQAFPCRLQRAPEQLRHPFALCRGQVRTEELRRYVGVRVFRDVVVSRLVGYPAYGVEIRVPKAAPEAGRQISEKLFELSLGWDHHQALNWVVVPDDQAYVCFVFPRPRDGRAVPSSVTHLVRWQYASLEFAGLLECKVRSLYDFLDPDTLRVINAEMSLDDDERSRFERLLDAF